VRSQPFVPLNSCEHRNSKSQSWRVPHRQRAEYCPQDVIPYFGLSMHKPSILWPPPTNVESDDLRKGIRSRLRRVTGLDDQGRLKSFLSSRGRPPPPRDEPTAFEQVAEIGRRAALGVFTPTPDVIEGQDQRIVLEVTGGETLHVDSQIQFYMPNNLISHPLISHCGAYLGGLPPLFFIAGDQEVLRDEIIYTWALSPHSSPLPLTHVPELTELRTHPSTPSQPRSNDSILRSWRMQQNTLLRRKSISKFTMGARMSCPFSSRSPPPRSIVSELSQTSVGSRPECGPSVLDLLHPRTGQNRPCTGVSWVDHSSRVRRRRMGTC